MISAASLGALAVDFFRIEDAIAHDFDLAGRRIDPAEEATAVALVTGRSANLVDSNQQRVGVAVVVDALQFLNVATLFAFSPQLLPAAAVVDDPSGLQRFLPRLFIHVGQHQDVPGFVVLSDDRDEVHLFEIRAAHH